MSSFFEINVQVFTDAGLFSKLQWCHVADTLRSVNASGNLLQMEWENLIVGSQLSSSPGTLEAQVFLMFGSAHKPVRIQLKIHW